MVERVTDHWSNNITVTFDHGGASGTLPNPITVNVGQTGSNAIYFVGNRPTISTSIKLVAQWGRLEGGEEF